MEYDEMTDEEYENNISDKAEAEYDRYREEKLIAQYEEEQERNDTQENFNKIVEGKYKTKKSESRENRLV